MGGFEYAEHRGTLPGEVGFECTFYEGLFYRTAPLRKSLYVVVATDLGEFRPNFVEHFPRSALAGYQLRSGLTALGQREPVDLVFRCYSPAGSGDAERGARIIEEAIGVLRERLGLPERSRSLAAMRDSRRFVKEHWRLNMGTPYRPPHGTLRGGASAPKPAGPSIGEELDRQLRGHLERWGVLEDYDRMKGASSRAAPRRRDPPIPEAFAPWAPPPEPEWLRQYRAFEEQQKAMSERWNGGW